MTVTLVTVPNVPIVSTGTYPLATGETTFSQEELADAVRAASDPTVPAPRIKIGHTDPRFAETIAAADFDGDPAFGTARNLTLSEDGQSVIADYSSMPQWLGGSLASAYPGRSIEGYKNYTAPSGRTYKLVIKAVSLLGTTWPGVSNLADLQEVLERNAVTAADDANGEAFATEPVTPIAAAIDLGNVRTQFVSDLRSQRVPVVADCADQANWWARSVRSENDGLCLIVDDDGGHLIRLPFTEADGTLNYGDPEIVVPNDLPVAASASGDGQRVLASWPKRAASRPSTTPEVTTMNVDAAVLRTRLGLADDADDAAILEALTAEPNPAPVAEPVAASTPQIPEGMTLVDQATLDSLRGDAQAGRGAADRLAREDRDRIVNAAIQEGRFPVSRRGHYEAAWDRDSDGTRTLLTASAAEGGLAPGLVPVAAREVGQSGDGEGQPAAIEAQHEEFMARQFPNEHARLRGSGNGRTRIRQEA